jgi:hypothetical protein
MTPARKHFQTPPCLNLFLDVEATETAIDFDRSQRQQPQRQVNGAEQGIGKAEHSDAHADGL